MKKAALIFLISFLTNVATVAQNPISIQAGINTTHLDLKNFSEAYESKIGFYLHSSVKFPLSNKYGTKLKIGFEKNHFNDVLTTNAITEELVQFTLESEVELYNLNFETNLYYTVFSKRNFNLELYSGLKLNYNFAKEVEPYAVGDMGSVIGDNMEEIWLDLSIGSEISISEKISLIVGYTQSMTPVIALYVYVDAPYQWGYFRNLNYGLNFKL